MSDQNSGGEAYASGLSLGSWHIFSRLSLEEGAQLVQGSLDRGIRQFDVGDYWDHDLSNTTRFREIVALLKLPRNAYKLSVKLFTSAAERRQDSLRKYADLLGVDQVDYAVCSRPFAGETLDQALEGMNELVAAGLTKHLAVGLWGADLLRKGYDRARTQGLATPRFVQFQYNVCRRDVVESPEFKNLFATTDIKLQAAFTLEGGVLAGHTARRRFDEADRERGEWFTDRNIARDSGGIRPRILEMVPRIENAAKAIGVSPATLAMAFPLTHQALDTLLFGATKMWQLDQALEAVKLAREQPDEIRELVAEFYVSGAREPALFDYVAGIH